jgi:hypothetical protein
MSVRRLLEKEILIRLSENGFVETIRYFALPDRCLAYELADAKSTDHAVEEHFAFARVRARYPESKS